MEDDSASGSTVTTPNSTQPDTADNVLMRNFLNGIVRQLNGIATQYQVELSDDSNDSQFSFDTAGVNGNIFTNTLPNAEIAEDNSNPGSDETADISDIDDSSAETPILVRSSSNSLVIDEASHFENLSADIVIIGSPSTSLQNEDNSSVLPQNVDDSSVDTQGTSVDATMNITRVRKTREEEGINEEPPGKKEKRDNKGKEVDSDDDDGQTCSICLESWSNFGTHRLCSLKCGHLFGHGCIMRWLSQKPAGQRTCPTCKASAKTKDLRFIYAKKVKMCDNYEIFTVKSEFSKAVLENNKLKLELHKVDLQKDSLRRKNIQLEAELKIYKSAVPIIKPATSVTNCVRQISFSKEMNVDITTDDSCRVFTYSTINNNLLVAQKVTNNVFPGYGVRSVDCGTGRLGILTVIHPKMIRDIAFSERNNLLLTASLDKTAKLYCDSTSNILMTLPCDYPLWSCCWDLERPDRLYLGAAGCIIQYDIRQPRSCVTTIQPVDPTPIVGLTYIPNGVLSCHLNSAIAHRKVSSTHFESKSMPLEGPMLSARAINSKVLVSSRPSSLNSRGRNTVCDIDLKNGFDFNAEHVFYSGNVRKLLSRSCLMDVAGGELLAVADNESERCVQVWKTSDSTRLQNISSSTPVIDTCSIKRGDDSFLATLTQGSCKLYKAIF